MKRLTKKAENSKNLLEIVEKMDKSYLDMMIKDICKYADSWADNEVEEGLVKLDDLESYDLSTEFIEQMLKDPDEVLEAVIDDFPEDLESEDIYGAPLDVRVETARFIIENADVELTKVFNSCVKGLEVEDNERDYNNAPYGPGMTQKDYL